MVAARMEAASSFLLQSPPGEINDVFNDIRSIVGDDNALETGILPALEQYNTEQLSILILISSPAARTSLRSTLPLNLQAASDPKPVETDPDTEAIRSELDKVLEAYVSNHYNDGVSATYALPDPEYPAPEPEPEVEPTPIAKEEEPVVVEKTEAEAGEAEMEVEGEEKVEGGEDEENKPEPAEQEEVVEAKEESIPEPEAATPASEPKEVAVPAVKSRIFGLYFVGNKYNPANYWTGRWRSIYTADLEAKTLTGTIKINIHYYEQGNVQLSTTHTITSELPSSNSTPSQILALIKSAEQTTQTALGESYATLSDDVFRGLRRALPKTRSKLDWGKISAYRLGTELGGGGQAATQA
ncbi:hypothetical protein P7C70_g1194, partial [Phenoliferia sp. Uapishka_3]